MGSYKPRVLCEIYYNNSLFSAWNDGKTSPRFRVKHEDGNVSYAGHAEMRALSRLPRGFNPNAVRVYVTRFKKDGKVAMAKPCVNCQAHLWRAGIKARAVRFTNNEGNWERFHECSS